MRFPNSYKFLKNQPEFTLQKSVCQYLNIQYPKAVYMSDTVASIKLTIPQQVRNKAIQKDGFKCPDLLIFEPNENFKGLFIELKNETPFKKNGEIKASQNNHLELQLKTLEQMKERGYYATFSWGFEMTKKIIDDYFSNKLA